MTNHVLDRDPIMMPKATNPLDVDLNPYALNRHLYYLYNHINDLRKEIEILKIKVE